MKLGSAEHKQELLDILNKTYQENIWKNEIQLFEMDELLGKLRTEVADIGLKLERKWASNSN